MARRRKKQSQSKRRSQRNAQVTRRDTPELQQARALWAANRFPQALALFDKALRKTPDNPLALLDAARAYGSRFEIDRAERLLERFLSNSGNKPGDLHLAGQSYRMIYRPRKAIACYQQALEMTRDLPDTHLELAVLYERRHRLDDAARHIEECLALRPSYAEAQFVRARLCRRLGHTQCATVSFSQLAQSAAHWLVTTQSRAELARIYEEVGDYDRAMESMVACKRILAANSKQLQRESARSYQHAQHLTDALAREDFVRWHEMPEPDAGDRIAFLTGSPRSGTTLLENVLNAHPDIICTDEVPAFPRYIYPAMLAAQGESLLSPADFHSIPAARLEQERQRYLKYMELALAEAIGDRTHVDKNPSILMLVPGMVRLFPASRLLIALRDPRDVVLSCFMCYLPLNTVSVSYLTLEKTVARFCQDLEAWLKFREFLVNPWHEVKYEEMVADFENTTRTCLEFLGVSWQDIVRDYRQHARDRAANSPTYEEVAKPIYVTSIGRWQRFAGYLQPHLEQLEKYRKILRYD